MSGRSSTDRETTSAPRAGGPPTADSVSAWLDVMVSMLRLPPAERGEVREELESHLRDRVRDLMLGGLDSEEAMARAVGELGDAADLAERFGAVRRDQRRRSVMNVLGLGVAAGAAVVSIAALVNSGVGGAGVGGPGPASTTPAIAANEDDPAALRRKVAEQAATIAALERQLAETKIRVSNEPFPARGMERDPIASLEVALEAVQGKPVMEALGLVAAQAGLKLEVLEPFPQDMVIAIPGVDGPTVSGESVVRAVSWEGTKLRSFPAITYRVAGDRLQLASDEYFNAREITTRSYSAGGLIGLDAASRRALADALLSITCSGPSLNPRINVIGTTVFATGDDTLHAQVRWVLEQAQAGFLPAPPSAATPE